MATEAGHHANRVYISLAGDLHINGGKVFNTAEDDISADLESLGDLTLAPGAALTAQLTTITHTAPGTPDYVLQNALQTTGFGFTTADEMNTTLSVIKNLQLRLAEVEARLEAAGIITAN